MNDAFVPLASVGGLPASLKNNPNISTWIRFDPTDSEHIEIYSGKVELGQNILTAIAQIASDELGVPLENIKMAGAKTGSSPDESITSGSLSIQHSGLSVRAACRHAKDLFIRALQVRQGLKKETVIVRDGRFYAGETCYGSYRDLLPSVDLNVPVEIQEATRPVSVAVGQDCASYGLVEKARGCYGFIQDMPMQDGLHGRMLRPPSINAKLISLVISSELESDRTIQVVRDGSLVGVLAAEEYVADRAIAQLAGAAVWEEHQSLPDEAQLARWLRSQDCETTVQTKHVQPASACADVHSTYVGDYLKPFIKHASIAPSCAYAACDEHNKLHVWTHSQGIYNLRADLAVAFNKDPRDIVVEHVPGSGCYGHNGADDAAYDAAWLSQYAQGKRVRVQWSRADELCWSPQGPAMSIKIEADVDAHGAIVDWRHAVWGPGHSLRPGRAATPTVLGSWCLEKPFPRLSAINAPLIAGGGADRNMEPLYEFNCSALACHRVLDMPIRTSSLRCLGAFGNVFAIESLLDDIATDHGIDPITYRVDMLSDARAIEVLDAVRRMSGWDERRIAGADSNATGLGVGFARYKNKGAYCAVVAEVVVTHEVAVKQLYIAVDVGEVINPDGVVQQIEGGAIQATSWATLEAAHFNDKALLDDDWEKYPIIRFSQVPQVQVNIISRPDESPVGAGEPSLGPTVAAIGNAVKNALGVRVTTLPLTHEQIARAIENTL